MKPPVFAYHRPASTGEALALLAEHRHAKPLAGGQSLIPAMNFRLAAPEMLIDLNPISSLAGITPLPGGGLRIGAMTRHRTLETASVVASMAPLLAEAMPFIAHPQIRNRGTIGGSLAHADPAAELPAVMVSLGATFVLTSRAGDRRMPAGEFFTGLFATALRPGELLTAVELPAMPAGSGSSFMELARRHGDFALVGVAVTVTLDAAGRCAQAMVTLFSVGEGPAVSSGAAKVLVGSHPSAEAIRAAAAAIDQDIDPPSDIHASVAYRRNLARVLAGRALTRAFERARSSDASTEQ